MKKICQGKSLGIYNFHYTPLFLGMDPISNHIQLTWYFSFSIFHQNQTYSTNSKVVQMQ